jgi:DNA invertase Pin-like site-specific DNA recombinase
VRRRTATPSSWRRRRARRLSKLKSKKRRPGRRGRYRLPDESVQRQLALIRDHAAKRGLNLPEHLIFCDNGLSAWKPGEGKRPDWDKMIKAGRAGMFGGLLTWKISRFARNVRDGEDLLDLGVLLDGPTTETGRESMRIDLRTAQGKSVFRQQVECAANESEEKSEMVRTAFADMLAHGYRVGGGGCGKSISAAPVEAIIREWVVDTSNDPDVQAKMRAADTALDKEREELAALLDGLDADIAEAEAKRAWLPRSQTRTRAFDDRNIANMQARYEDAERMLAELGETSRRAPRVPPITAEKWDHPQVYTPADRADIIRRLGKRVSILPNPQGRPSRPFDPERVVGADGRPLT